MQDNIWHQQVKVNSHLIKMVFQIGILSGAQFFYNFDAVINHKKSHVQNLTTCSSKRT